MKFKTNEEREDSINRIIEDSKTDISNFTTQIRNFTEAIPGLNTDFLKCYFNPSDELYEIAGVFTYYSMSFFILHSSKHMAYLTNSDEFQSEILRHKNSLEIPDKRVYLKNMKEYIEMPVPETVPVSRSRNNTCAGAQPTQLTQPITAPDTHTHAWEGYTIRTDTPIQGLYINTNPTVDRARDTEREIDRTEFQRDVDREETYTIRPDRVWNTQEAFGGVQQTLAQGIANHVDGEIIRDYVRGETIVNQSAGCLNHNPNHL
jgi:hypothetical protein